jgi:hypothetical protein
VSLALQTASMSSSPKPRLASLASTICLAPEGATAMKANAVRCEVARAGAVHAADERRLCPRLAFPPV